MIKHSYPFPSHELLKVLESDPVPDAMGGVLFDLKGFVPVFFEDVKKINKMFQWEPDYYLLEVLCKIHETLFSLKYWHVYFHMDPEFFNILYPGGEEYQSTKEELEFYREEMQFLVREIHERRDFYEEMLKLGLSHFKVLDKLVTNFEFQGKKYEKYKNYYTKNQLTYRLSHGLFQFFDEKSQKLGDAFFVMNLPQKLKDKILSESTNKTIRIHKKRGRSSGTSRETIARLVPKVIDILAKKPMSQRELRKQLGGKYQYIQKILHELDDLQIIEQNQLKKWELKKTMLARVPLEKIINLIFYTFNA